MKKLLAALAVVVLLSAAIGGTVYAAKPDKCSPWPSCKDGGDPAPTPPPTLNITVFNFGYDPADYSTTAGATITAHVTEGRHTITSVAADANGDPVFDTGVKKSRDGEFTLTAPLTPGTYAYFCTIHGFNKMNAVITVQ